MRLTERDYELLEKSWITRELAIAAGITRLSALEAAEAMHITGVEAHNCEGLHFPYRPPGEAYAVGARLRLDNPPIEAGKVKNKYRSPPGQRIHAYMPLEDPADLKNPKKPLWIAEGEKKYLALRRAALEGAALAGANGNGHAGGPATLAMVMTFPGCWSWRGQIGIVTNENGRRVAEKGVIPDIDRLVWTGREVLILYDSNCAANPKVRASRQGLARELESRGAIVWWVDLLPEPGINGPDDYLAAHGLHAFLKLIEHPVRYDWRHELARSDKGKVLAGISNALIALRMAPPWNGVLAFNEFGLCTEARASTPWGGPASVWTDNHDVLTVEWLEHQGVKLARGQVADAVQAVAREHTFHPVREYLDGLKWDGISRIDDWLVLYLGAKQSSYHAAVGARWLISAVARIRQPGCKVDHALILESPQGLGKSTAFAILGGPFYSDDLAEVGTKDSAMGVAGAWIVELSELDAMGRADISKTKSFLSRRVDRFRPPYGRHIVEVPRQSVFCGTVNQAEYLKDETGGRRFWPVKCGSVMRLEELRRDRDQIWAEAAVRYERGDRWWLDDEKLIEAAASEQDERFQSDPWEELIKPWLASRTEVTTAQTLIEAVHKEPGQWTRADEIRVAAVLRRLKWERGPRAPESVSPTRQRLYRPKGDA